MAFARNTGASRNWRALGNKFRRRGKRRVARIRPSRGGPAFYYRTGFHPDQEGRLFEPGGPYRLESAAPSKRHVDGLPSGLLSSMDWICRAAPSFPGLSRR